MTLGLGQGGTSDRLSGLESYVPHSLKFEKRVVHSLGQNPECRDNAFALKGLSFFEAYLEGHLRFCVIFDPRHPGEKLFKGHVRVVACAQAHIGETKLPSDVIPEPDILNVHRRCCGQDAGVLVGDVQQVEAEQVCSIPSFVRLYDIEDVVDDEAARSMTGLFMSIDGTLTVLPVAFRDKRKGAPFSDGVPVSDDQNAVSMIKGGSEVMERVPQDRGRMLWETNAETKLFPTVSVFLGSKSLSIRTNMLAENIFKVSDVVFGPLGL